MLTSRSIIKSIVIVLLVSLSTLFFINKLAWYRANIQRPLVEYVGVSKILNTSFEETNNFKEDSSFILHSHIIRQPYECWGEYSATLYNNKAFYPIGVSKSTIISDVVIETDINVGYQIPKHIPSGDYELKIVVFPECNGYDLPPFNLQMGKPTLHIDGE